MGEKLYSPFPPEMARTKSFQPNHPIAAIAAND